MLLFFCMNSWCLIQWSEKGISVLFEILWWGSMLFTELSFTTTVSKRVILNDQTTLFFFFFSKDWPLSTQPLYLSRLNIGQYKMTKKQEQQQKKKAQFHDKQKNYTYQRKDRDYTVWITREKLNRKNKISTVWINSLIFQCIHYR